MLYLQSKAFLCVGFLFLISAFKGNNVPREILLETAINNKTVTFRAFSNGKYSGNSVRINISNNTNSSIRIVVPAGTNYFTQDNGEQKLIQIEDRFIALKPKGDFSGLIAAFCYNKFSKLKIHPYDSLFLAPVSIYSLCAEMLVHQCHFQDAR